MNRTHIVPLAVAFEAALGLAGWWLATWAGVPIQRRMTLTSTAAARGLFATLPMLLLLAVAIRVPWRPLVELKQRVAIAAREMFAGARLVDLALVSLAAGLGEEILFRGAIQPLAITWTNAAGGVALASILFGSLHAASPTYFVVATLIGGYLGWLAETYDDLLAPILAHAAYDFVALAVLVRTEHGLPHQSR